MTARPDTAPVYKHGWAVQPRYGHNTTRHVLVAAANSNKSVKPLTGTNRLNRVGDDFARHKRILHPFSSHGNAVGNSDRPENNPLASGLIHPRNRLFGQLVDMHIARSQHAPGGGHTHLGPGKILIFEADGPQQGTIRRPGISIGNTTGKLSHILLWHKISLNNTC